MAKDNKGPAIGVQEKKVLRFIAVTCKSGPSPSWDEIETACGISGRKQLKVILTNLKKEELLDWKPGATRTFRVPEKVKLRVRGVPRYRIVGKHVWPVSQQHPWGTLMVDENEFSLTDDSDVVLVTIGSTWPSNYMFKSGDELLVNANSDVSPLGWVLFWHQDQIHSGRAEAIKNATNFKVYGSGFTTEKGREFILGPVLSATMKLPRP